MILRTYHRLLVKLPTLTQCATSGTLMSLGDYLTQAYVKKQRKYNYERTARFALLGTCVTGPLNAVWFRYLENRFGSKGVLTPLKKVALTTLVFAPIFQAVYIIALCKIRRQSWLDVHLTFVKSYAEIMTNNILFWPWIQLLTFYVIPLNYRVIFTSAVGLGWNIYLAWKLDKPIHDPYW